MIPNEFQNNVDVEPGYRFVARNNDSGINRRCYIITYYIY